MPAVEPIHRNLTVRNGRSTLTGSLLIPPGRGPFPGVVLLAGNAPAERQRAEADAHLFAANGVAAYLFDRREDAASGGWRAALSVDDAIGDAVAAVAALRRQSGIDATRVGVWGVGQGAWLAPFVGEHADVAFVILLNATAAPLGQQEVWRAGAAVRADGHAPAAADAAMRAVRLLVATRPVLAALLPPGRLGFLGSDPSQTPAGALAQASAPALLVYGDLDPHAPGVKTTAALLRTAQQRDQPLDHVTVLGLGADGDPAGASSAARRAADATYRSVVVGWTRTVVGSSVTGNTVAGNTVGGNTVPGADGTSLVPAVAGATLAAATGQAPAAPPSDAALLLPGASDRPPPWYASPWLQLASVVFFLVAFGEGLVMSVMPPRRRAGTVHGVRQPIADDGSGSGRTARALRLAQGLVSLVDLVLLVGAALAIAYLLGLYRPAGLTLGPLAAGLRTLSAVSGALAIGLAVLILLGRRAGALPPRPAVAVLVALAAALFLPFLVYWHVPFLAG